MTDELIERTAQAIDNVQLFSRFNNWTSDRVPGLPIEICRYGEENEDEIVVVERFGGAITEAEALADTVSKARARAAVEATNVATLETALRTIQSAVPKYLKKEMTAEEFALVVISEADSGKVNKALEGKK